MPLSPEGRQRRARVAALRRHHPDQPDLVDADAAALKTDAAAEEFIQLIVDGFPPLTAEQRARLAVLLRGGGDAPAA